jgi:hypothetical protein
MFSNKFRKGAGRAAALLAATALLTTGVAPANAADATPVFLSFEADDIGKATAVGPDGTFSGASALAAASTNLTGDSLKFTKAGDPWSGVNLFLETSPGYRYTNAANPVITMDYWSNDTEASCVMMKLTRKSDQAFTAKALATAPGLNTLSFDMTTGRGYDAAVEYNLVTLFPNFCGDDNTYTGAGAIANTGQVYEIDNVSINGGTIADILVGGGEPPVGPVATVTSLTFETSDTLGALVVGDSSGAKPQGSFAGTATTIEDAIAGGNGGKALKIVKNGEPYAGVNLVALDAATNRVTNAANPVVSFNYYSSKANSPLRVELIPYPVGFGTTVTAAQGWSRIVIDFSSVDGWSADTNYSKIGLFPDFNVAADGGIYYVDNLSFNGATAPAITVARAATSTVLTFETSDTLGGLAAGVADANKPQGGFEGLDTSIADAPTGGTGGKVLKMIKNAGAKTYAGVNLVKFVADTRVTNGTNKVITMNYYSAKANSTVRLEVRPYPAAVGVNVTATKVGWQRLTFDFTSAAGWSADTEFGDLTLFPDFDVAGANTTYYVDDVAFNGAATPTLPTPVVAVKPALRTAATVAGTAKVGKTLTAGKGSWTGTATIAYTYKWYRCTVVAKTATTALPASSAKCSAISGGTKSTYKLASADVGKYVRVLVTAKNSKGYAYSLSKSTTGKVAK